MPSEVLSNGLVANCRSQNRSSRGFFGRPDATFVACKYFPLNQSFGRGLRRLTNCKALCVRNHSPKLGYRQMNELHAK